MTNKVNLIFVLLIFAAMVAAQDRRVLTILVNFQDKQEQPFTREFAVSEMTKVDAFYRENSYGRQNFADVDVLDWRTIPVSYVGCDKNLIASEARKVAVSAGKNLADYDHFIYAFPANRDCFFTGSTRMATHEIWINDWFFYEIVSHELGHSLGLFHSKSRLTEYGDVFDVMGGSPKAAHFNLYQKERLGWVTPQLVTTSGVYRIGPYETTGQGLKIFKANEAFGSTVYYYIEKRTARGFDAYLSMYPRAMNGVLVHTGSSNLLNQIYLEDMMPLTTTLDDSPLVTGETYSDGNVSITTISADDTGADVQVTITATPTPTPVPSPTPTPVPTPAVCVKTNPKGKCLKWSSRL